MSEMKARRMTGNQDQIACRLDPQLKGKTMRESLRMKLERKKELAEKKKAKQIGQARESCGKLDLFQYFGPLGKVNIQRRLIDAVAKHTLDWLDAAACIADFVQPHIRRMEAMDFGQSEAIIQKPFNATWHVLKMEEIYVADTEFFPY
jgi:hypothetical protein